MPNLVKKNNCTGCMACVDSCAKKAIQIVEEQGLCYPTVDFTRCVECGICEKRCPQLHPINPNRRSFLIVKGGWCVDSNMRKRAASGGAFSALAKWALSQGYIVVGACLRDDGTVVHRVIDRLDLLSLLQNSKYGQSNMAGIYIKVKDLLRNEKKVLFSGTPCQVAALRTYLAKDYDNLMTVDVVCNGVPSREAIELLIRKQKATKIISYRGKEFGWNDVLSQGVTYETSTGVFFPQRSKDLFYRVFSCGLTHRAVCCRCRYSKLPRYADITLADFWGIQRFEEEWTDGISLVVCNNKKGLDFVNGCDGLHLFDSTLEECVKANPRLVNGWKFHGWHPIMVWRKQIRKILGERNYERIILNKMPYKLLWGVLRIMTTISNRVSIRKELRYEKENRNNNYI